jgi:hypothetical protein
MREKDDLAAMACLASYKYVQSDSFTCQWSQAESLSKVIPLTVTVTVTSPPDGLPSAQPSCLPRDYDKVDFDRDSEL